MIASFLIYTIDYVPFRSLLSNIFLNPLNSPRNPEPQY